MSPTVSSIIHKATRFYYDNITNEYDNLYKDPISYYEDKIVEGVTKKFLNHHSSPSSVLDLGCGTGFGYEIIKPAEYLGIDFSKEMIKKAKHLHPNARFITGDFDKTNFPINSFENVVSFYGSLSHSTDLKNIVAKINQTLAPGGRFVLMFYSRFSLRNIISSIFHLNFEFLSKLRPYQIRNFDKNEPPPIPAYFYSVGDLKKSFKQFDDITFYGLNYLAELPLIKSFLKRNKKLAELILNLEFRAIGKLAPNLGYSIIVLGKKESSNAS